MDDLLKAARKRAERAVEDMADGPLKIAAFQTILGKLLAVGDPEKRDRRTSGTAMTERGREPGTLTGRILAIGSEGFFKEQRSLAEVRQALGSRGWRYPVAALGVRCESLAPRNVFSASSNRFGRARMSDSSRWHNRNAMSLGCILSH